MQTLKTECSKIDAESRKRNKIDCDASTIRLLRKLLQYKCKLDKNRPIPCTSTNVRLGKIYMPDVPVPAPCGQCRPRKGLPTPTDPMIDSNNIISKTPSSQFEVPVELLLDLRVFTRKGAIVQITNLTPDQIGLPVCVEVKRKNGKFMRVLGGGYVRRMKNPIGNIQTVMRHDSKEEKFPTADEIDISEYKIACSNYRRVIEFKRINQLSVYYEYRAETFELLLEQLYMDQLRDNKSVMDSPGRSEQTRIQQHFTQIMKLSSPTRLANALISSLPYVSRFINSIGSTMLCSIVWLALLNKGIFKGNDPTTIGQVVILSIYRLIRDNFDIVWKLLTQIPGSGQLNKLLQFLERWRPIKLVFDIIRQLQPFLKNNKRAVLVALTVLMFGGAAAVLKFGIAGFETQIIQQIIRTLTPLLQQILPAWAVPSINLGFALMGRKTDPKSVLYLIMSLTSAFTSFLCGKSKDPENNTCKLFTYLPTMIDTCARYSQLFGLAYANITTERWKAALSGNFSVTTHEALLRAFETTCYAQSRESKILRTKFSGVMGIMFNPKIIFTTGEQLDAALLKRSLEQSETDIQELLDSLPRTLTPTKVLEAMNDDSWEINETITHEGKTFDLTDDQKSSLKKLRDTLFVHAIIYGTDSKDDKMAIILKDMKNKTEIASRATIEKYGLNRAYGKYWQKISPTEIEMTESSEFTFDASKFKETNDDNLKEMPASFLTSDGVENKVYQINNEFWKPVDPVISKEEMVTQVVALKLLKPDHNVDDINKIWESVHEMQVENFMNMKTNYKKTQRNLSLILHPDKYGSHNDTEKTNIAKTKLYYAVHEIQKSNLNTIQGDLLTLRKELEEIPDLNFKKDLSWSDSGTTFNSTKQIKTYVLNEIKFLDKAPIVDLISEKPLTITQRQQVVTSISSLVLKLRQDTNFPISPENLWRQNQRIIRSPVNMIGSNKSWLSLALDLLLNLRVIQKGVIPDPNGPSDNTANMVSVLRDTSIDRVVPTVPKVGSSEIQPTYPVKFIPTRPSGNADFTVFSTEEDGSANEPDEDMVERIDMGDMKNNIFDIAISSPLQNMEQHFQELNFQNGTDSVKQIQKLDQSLLKLRTHCNSGKCDKIQGVIDVMSRAAANVKHAQQFIQNQEINMTFSELIKYADNFTLTDQEVVKRMDTLQDKIGITVIKWNDLVSESVNNDSKCGKLLKKYKEQKEYLKRLNSTTNDKRVSRKMTEANREKRQFELKSLQETVRLKAKRATYVETDRRTPEQDAAKAMAEEWKAMDKNLTLAVEAIAAIERGEKKLEKQIIMQNVTQSTKDQELLKQVDEKLAQIRLEKCQHNLSSAIQIHIERNTPNFISEFQKLLDDTYRTSIEIDEVLLKCKGTESCEVATNLTRAQQTNQASFQIENLIKTKAFNLSMPMDSENHADELQLSSIITSANQSVDTEVTDVMSSALPNILHWANDTTFTFAGAQLYNTAIFEDRNTQLETVAGSTFQAVVLTPIVQGIEATSDVTVDGGTNIQLNADEKTRAEILEDWRIDHVVNWFLYSFLRG